VDHFPCRPDVDHTSARYGVVGAECAFVAENVPESRNNRSDQTRLKRNKSDYPATFFACVQTFAHRFFAAFTIAALPAADKTRFFTPTTSRSHN
jgi:hypothetical protein